MLKTFLRRKGDWWWAFSVERELLTALMQKSAKKDRRFPLYCLIITSVTFIAFLPTLRNGLSIG